MHMTKMNRLYLQASRELANFVPYEACNYGHQHVNWRFSVRIYCKVLTDGKTNSLTDNFIMKLINLLISEFNNCSLGGDF